MSSLLHGSECSVAYFPLGCPQGALPWVSSSRAFLPETQLGMESTQRPSSLPPASSAGKEGGEGHRWWWLAGGHRLGAGLTQIHTLAASQGLRSHLENGDGTSSHLRGLWGIHRGCWAFPMPEGHLAQSKQVISPSHLLKEERINGC